MCILPIFLVFKDRDLYQGILLLCMLTLCRSFFRRVKPFLELNIREKKPMDYISMCSSFCLDPPWNKMRPPSTNYSSIKPFKKTVCLYILWIVAYY